MSLERLIAGLMILLLLGACASGNRPLQLISGAGAVYPPTARSDGVEGHVIVRYDVDEAGRVLNARVVSATPPDVFDESALQAVRRWQFQAPRRNGEPQAVSGLESRLTFSLSGGDSYRDY